MALTDAEWLAEHDKRYARTYGTRGASEADAARAKMDKTIGNTAVVAVLVGGSLLAYFISKANSRRKMNATRGMTP